MSCTINGSAGLTTNSGAVYNGISSGTAVASTSGTSIDFTSIPSWVKRITVMFNATSTTGTSNIQVQLGDSGGIENTGYVGSAINIDTGISGTGNSAGFLLMDSNAANTTLYGIATICLITGTTWAFSSNLSTFTSGTANVVGAGVKALSGVLTTVRITTVNGTDTFDAGSINILYE